MCLLSLALFPPPSSLPSSLLPTGEGHGSKQRWREGGGESEREGSQRRSGAAQEKVLIRALEKALILAARSQILAMAIANFCGGFTLFKYADHVLNGCAPNSKPTNRAPRPNCTEMTVACV